MNRSEFENKINASMRQVYHWMNMGVPFDGKTGRGPGFPIDYSERDVEICNFLSKLSPLVGIGTNSVSPTKIFSGVGLALRKDPNLLKNEFVYIDQTGNVSLDPVEGWVVRP